jgi:hypothetical protein
MKELLHITAKHKTTYKVVDMEFKSIAEAKFHNKNFIDFKIVGYADKKQKRL